MNEVDLVESILISWQVPHVRAYEIAIEIVEKLKENKDDIQ